MRRGMLVAGLFALLTAACGLKVPLPEEEAGTALTGSRSAEVAGGEGVSAADAGQTAQSGLNTATSGTSAQAKTALGDAKKDAAAKAGEVSGIFANETEGLTDTTIRICAHIPITGAAAIDRNPNRFGKFYFDWVNSNGGIHGRKVEYIAYDDQYNPPFAVAAAERCKASGAFMILGAAGTDQLVAVAKWAARNKLPYLMGPASVKDVASYSPYAKMTGPDYEYQHRLLADFFAKDPRYGKGVNYGMIRVNSPFFTAAHDAFVAQLKTHGIELKVDEVVQKDENTFTAILAKLQANNVQVVNNFTTPIIWLKMMKQRPASYQPTWTAVSPAAGFNIVAEILTGEGGSASQAGNALVFHHFNPAYPATGTDNSDGVIDRYPYAGEIRKFKQIFDSYATVEPKAPRDDIDWSAYLSSKTIHRLLLKSGRDLTRTKVWRLLDSYKETPVEATPACPLDFTRERDRGSWFVNVFRLGTRQWENVSTCVDRVG